MRLSPDALHKGNGDHVHDVFVTVCEARIENRQDRLKLSLDQESHVAHEHKPEDLPVLGDEVVHEYFECGTGTNDTLK
jgi:hypothetical protein